MGATQFLGGDMIRSTLHNVELISYVKQNESSHSMTTNQEKDVDNKTYLELFQNSISLTTFQIRSVFYF